MTVRQGAFLLCLACATGCGGESGTGPSSLAGINLVGANPPPGSTVTLVASGNGLSAPFSMTLRVISDHEIAAPAATVQWYASGKYCGAVASSGIDASFGGEPLFGDAVGLPIDALRANQPYTLAVQTMFWAVEDRLPGPGFPGQCPLPATTSTVLVTISCRLCGPGETRNTPFSKEIPSSYTFVAPMLPQSRVPACGSLNPRLFSCVDLPPGGPLARAGVCKNGLETCAPKLASACSHDGGLACVACPGPFCS